GSVRWPEPEIDERRRLAALGIGYHGIHLANLVCRSQYPHAARDGFAAASLLSTMGRTMRLLYHLWLSPFARKIRIVLQEKNLDFTMKVEKTWERRPEFLALNPAGDVPVLIEPDGTVLAEAGAIAEFLDEVYRDKLLIGINALDRAEVRRLTQW